MITVNLSEGKNSLSLRVEGHAGAGAWGKDLVCAAASILTYTAAAQTRQLYRRGILRTRPHIRLAPGKAKLFMENCPEAKQMLEVLCTGFDLLALRYPKNVQFVRIGKERNDDEKL